MAYFVVYSTTSGSSTARPVTRWGECPVASIAAQAGTDEGASEVASLGSLATATSPTGYTINTVTAVLTFVGSPYSPTAAEYEQAVFKDTTRIRDALRASDWAVLSDAPLTAPQKADWITYRSALRALALDSAFGQPASDFALPVAPTTTEF